MAADDTFRRFAVEPSKPARLAKVDPGDTSGAGGAKANKNSAEKAVAKLHERLGELQERLWAENERSLLVVFQAIDAGGKDGVIKKVFAGVNPQGCRVTSFKVPVGEELAHDFLWRVHKAVPARGEIGIFNRSHYEDVLIVRVHGLVPESVWSARYELINDFEANLAAGGTTIVKFLLHISKEEQAERFRRRIERPDKKWKFRVEDLEERKYWDAYQEAFEDALTKTSTVVAPWYVIPANHKWFRDWAVLSIIVETLERMDPQYPVPAEDLSVLVIE